METSKSTKIPVICLIGPTATGKTQLAIRLAKRLNTEIISADSAMVYRGLDIGTAKPSLELRQNIPHHLIDICSPIDIYSAGQFCDDVTQLIQKHFVKDQIPLIAGGTMLYFHLLQNGMANLPKKNETIRGQLPQKAKLEGFQTLHQLLTHKDPETAKKLHPNDIQRLQRALEIYYITGRQPSQLYQEQKLDCPFTFISIALLPPSKTLLHEKIKIRFDQMLHEGFIDEVEQLYYKSSLHANLPALRTVGYRQIWQYLEGKYDYETMIDQVLSATHQLAKHQMTWLKRWESPNMLTLRYDEEKLIEKILCALETFKTI